MIRISMSRSEQTVSVNGVVYHKKTGMPLREERGPGKPDHAARTVHTKPQRSKTLSRRYVHRQTEAPKPAKTAAPAKTQPSPAADTPVAISVHKKPTQPTITRSPMVTRHAPAMKPTVKHTGLVSDIAPTSHHLVNRALAKQQKPQPAVRPPSHIVKQLAIDKALRDAPAKAERTAPLKLAKTPSRSKRLLSIASASLAVLLLGAYFTYLNMPTLSTRIAASQAGINANYPHYQPMGYSLNGPVAYDQGSVTMTFAANGSPQRFTLTQSRSGFDSLAVLDSVVAPKAGTNYQTTSSGGLTVYTYDGGAAWVSGGILYQIDGDARLSPEQVQRIATSM